jgi:ribosome-binding factor A
MASRRLEKAAEAIRGVVSMAILAELKDPRVRDVTVTRVEVSADMRYAKVHVSVMGNETQQQLSLRGLQSAAGFLQSKIGERIEIRYIPRLTFVLDEGVKRSIAIAKILHEVLPHNAATEAEDASDETDDAPPAAPDSRGDVSNPSGQDFHE